MASAELPPFSLGHIPRPLAPTARSAEADLACASFHCAVLVEYAQKLMKEHPEMHLDDIAEESGFSSRTTFFRSFKALTGTTPQEWKTKA